MGYYIKRDYLLFGYTKRMKVNENKLLFSLSPEPNSSGLALSGVVYLVSLDMKGCICHFVKWQIHPFISKGTIHNGASNIFRVGSITSIIKQITQIYSQQLECRPIFFS